MHRLLLRAALAGASVFAWIFIFQYFYVRTHFIDAALANTALTYALTQVIAVLLTPYAAARLRRGFKWTLVFATLSLAAAYVVLAGAFAGILYSAGWGVGIFALVLGIYRGLYWVPYEMARAMDMQRTKRHDLALALVPGLTGLFLNSYPYAPVFLLIAAAMLVGFSLVPLSAMRDVMEGYSWSYRGTFHELISSARRRMLIQSLLSGIEATALLLMWPLAMFMLFGWSYGTLGVVLVLTYLLTYVLRRAFHRSLTEVSPELSAVSVSAAWLMRLGVGGAIGVVLVDTFFYTGSHAGARGVDMLSFEQAADNNTFVDEHTALKEIAMGIGRILLCLFIALIAGVVSVPLVFMLTFALAAAAAGASVLLGSKAPRRFV